MTEQEEKQMIKFMLNKYKFNNYAFFCPVSRMHLTVSSPVGFSNEVTPAILKGLKAKTILDVDGVIDLETGTVKEAQAKVQAPQPEQVVEAPIEESKETEAKKKEQEPKANKSTNKRGKKSEGNPVDEAAK